MFKNCVSLYKTHIEKQETEYLRFDSTIVALSSKLLNVGYLLKGGGAEGFRQVKFTVGYGDIPEIVSFYTEQQHSSENICLKGTILEQSEVGKPSIKIFDRGLNSRDTYDIFTENKIQFVSRISPGAKHKVIKAVQHNKQFPKETASLYISKDDWCQLYGDKDKKAKNLVRRIEAKKKDSGEAIAFVSNNEELTAEEITGYNHALMEIK